MRIILINAQQNRKEKLGVFSRFVPLTIPVGIATLASYLIAKGYDVRLWDDAIEMLDSSQIEDLIKESSEPYIFGISCVTASIIRGYQIARQIKNRIPKAIIIFGGIHPTVLPDDAFIVGGADFVIRQEGEIPMEQLCLALKNSFSYEHILNLSFKRKGVVVHNSAVAGPDMSSLPRFPYYLFEKYIGRYDFGFVLSSRGCPYDCIFCSQRSITDRRFTSRTPEQVVSDIELLVEKYSRRLITFMDDNMLTDKKRVVEICRLIVSNGLNKKTVFQAQARGDAIDEELLKSLKAANFTMLDFGLETASERLMKLINKNETVAENVHALELAKKFGFELSGTFIMGLPTETEEDRRHAYRLARKYLDYVRFNNATPYPGTKLYEIARKENRLNIGKDWENLNACGTLIEGPFAKKRLAYVPVGTDELELKTDILKYNLFFNFRWKVISRILSSKSATAGWFKVSQDWFLKSQECLALATLVFVTLKNFFGLFILLMLFNLKKVFKNIMVWGRSAVHPRMEARLPLTEDKELRRHDQ